MEYDIDLSSASDFMNKKAYDMLHILASRYIISYGGAGSGKSYGITQYILIMILTLEGHRFLIARKYATSLKRSVFQLFLDLILEWGLSDLFKTNLTDMTITCLNGNKIMFVGLDDVEKLKSIAGVTGIWIEEATEVTVEDFMQLDLRLRGNTKHHLQILLSFNPTSSRSWLKKRFFDKKDDNVHIIHTTYKDNKFIDEHYKQTLENLINQDDNFHKIYALGKWGTLKGRIFEEYKTIDILPEDYQLRKYGLDFGFNAPMALIEIREDNNNLYLYECYYRTKTTTDELIQYMKQEGISTRDSIYCDSAEPDRIETLKNAGFNAIAAKKNVRAGIDAVKSKSLHVSKQSTNLIKEFDNYSWKEDKDGNSLEEPVKFNDHLMDALRYAVFTTERHARQIIVSPRRKTRFAGYGDYSGFKGF
ncbi:PBSX family phage terminase large subunit [Sulfurimonas aquatica]|uniref:PBSX family phage terminase large subunit n=1 Tax=Sulfurimonas aquatica TaxID=2672570 RepID=A0A975AZB4_9BACT|nr:PBSX family phage terminase large subunit [Sulfurimonas aquatica]QSZ41359.1 PBSX family phage terminase large subunit [Sulfurimonas aquatica]